MQRPLLKMSVFFVCVRYPLHCVFPALRVFPPVTKYTVSLCLYSASIKYVHQRVTYQRRTFLRERHAQTTPPTSITLKGEIPPRRRMLKSMRWWEWNGHR